MTTTYDELTRLERLAELISECESEVAYRSDGGADDRLAYLVIANLRTAYVGLSLIDGDRGPAISTPRWTVDGL